MGLGDHTGRHWGYWEDWERLWGALACPGSLDWEVKVILGGTGNTGRPAWELWGVLWAPTGSTGLYWEPRPAGRGDDRGDPDGGGERDADPVLHQCSQ